MRYLAAILTLVLVWACAFAVADDKRMSKMPPKAALGTKGAAAGKGATPSAPTQPQPGVPPAPTPSGALPAPVPSNAPPAPPPTVTRIPLVAADLIAADGRSVGTVVLTQTASGVRLDLALRDLPPGEHGFHLHTVGKCEPPSFASAGTHFNPENKKHGFFARDGHHAGDMPNILIPANGALSTTIMNNKITLERRRPHSVFHEGGTAIVIHDKFDDYITDPIGNSGGRIACGVVK